MKKVFQSHFLGGILLIAGTTLGVGMLAFPTVTAFAGLIPSGFLFLLIWLLMLGSAFFFLDANLSIEGENNMITMAEKRLGLWGKTLAWVIYLLLLYSLTAAYIAGCGPLIAEAISDLTSFTIPTYFIPLLLPLLFVWFIYAGTRGVDLLNRWLMIGLVFSYIILVTFLPSHVVVERLMHIDFPAAIFAIPVVITAFGYHIIIPTLATYLRRNRRELKKTILIGSLIPIIVYLLWEVLVLGAVPIPNLAKAFEQGIAATTPLSAVLHNSYIGLAAKFFAFFAIVTSFVGVTLSLSDFLIDGLKIKKTQFGRLGAVLLTFLPPLFFVYAYPKGFYLALQYAGAFVAILLAFLPAMMVWKLKKYQTPMRRFILVIVIFSSLCIVFLDLLQESGKLTYLISKYF